MKVIVCGAPFKISVKTKKTPQAKRGEVLVRLSYCGICVYDLKRYSGLKEVDYPLVLGHEPSGIIEEIGEGVQSLKKGDRVVVDVKKKCGECPSCLRGQESRCVQAEASFGFAQYILVPQENAFKISPDLDLKIATLTEPLACILHGYRDLDLGRKKSLLIIGDGIMGILAGFVGKVLEKKAVTLLGHHKERCEIARVFGAECVLPHENKMDPIDAFDAIFFTVGAKEIIKNITKFLQPGGYMVFIGELKDKNLYVDLNAVYGNEYNMIGRKGYTREDFEQALRIIERYQGVFAEFISKVYPFDELSMGFEDLKTRNILKGILCLEGP
jgi:L-iditol 2-dehydrogenase